MRQVRKEERKEERRQARKDKHTADEQDIDHETYLREVGFDPELMRAQRCIYLNIVALSLSPLGEGLSRNFLSPYRYNFNQKGDKKIEK